MNNNTNHDILDLGTWLGRRQAFSHVAGRCSAADAECLRRLREEKKYKSLDMSWEQFCKQRIGISRSAADLLIRQLEEFGPDFFELAQATGVTAEDYRRRIAGNVRGHALLHAGEAIPIDADNGPRLAAAIEDLKRNVEPCVDASGPAGGEDRGFAKAERSLRAALVELERLQAMRLDAGGRSRLMALAGSGADKLKRLELSIRV